MRGGEGVGNGRGWTGAVEFEVRGWHVFSPSTRIGFALEGREAEMAGGEPGWCLFPGSLIGLANQSIKQLLKMTTSLSKAIDYIEVPTRDVALSRAFFSDLLGWEFSDHGSDYHSFKDGRIAGGFYRSDKVSRVGDGGVLVVIYAEELEELKAEVIRLGGVICKDIFDFPGGRRFQFTEPGGSEFAIWSEKETS